MTLVGICSDTHDHKDHIIAVLKAFEERNITVMLHAGDVIAPFVTKWFTGSFIEKTDLHIVFGNNDGEKFGLKRTFSKIGKHHGDFGEIEIDALKFALYHGTVPAQTKALVASGEYDVVVTGHTHRFLFNIHENGTIHINPGAVCGYLTDEPSAVIFDTEKKEIVYRWTPNND